jgi:hypothetical protein
VQCKQVAEKAAPGGQMGIMGILIKRFTSVFLLVGLLGCTEFKSPLHKAAESSDESSLATVSQITFGKIQIDDMVFSKSNFTTAADGFIAYYSSPWTNGNLPIQFAPNISGSQRDMFLRKCAEWEQFANISCEIREGEGSYLLVMNDGSGGCWSYVGMNPAGESRLNLGDGCWDDYTVSHEIGHALGFAHEHQRPDRDQYVNVDARIVNDSAYKIISLARPLGSYDFESVMHYPTTYFGDGSLALSPRPEYQSHFNTMGLSRTPTSLDGQGLARIYGSRSAAPSPPPPTPSASASLLASGAMLLPGASIQSPNGQFRLIYQTDGNLVIYNAAGNPVWHTNTYGTSPGRAHMQPDGNFVVYNSSGQPLWHTFTYGRNGASLAMQDDGNLVIYSAGFGPNPYGQGALWSWITGRLY